MKPPRPPSAFRYGLLFAAVTALLVFQPLTNLTYLYLFYPEADQMIQTPIDEGLPIPRALAWRPSTTDLIANLGRLTSSAVLGLEIGLFCVLFYALLRILNPTFRLTTGVDWDKTLLTRTYMHTPPVIKAFLIAVFFFFFPAFVLWNVLGYALGGGLFSLWVRAALAGAGFFLLYSRNGVAADYESGNYEFPRDRRVLGSLLLRGAMAGTVALVVGRCAGLVSPEGMFRFYRTLGDIGEGNWWRLVALSAGVPAVLSFAAGGLAVALGTPDKDRDARLRAAVLPFLLLTATVVIVRVGLPLYLSVRYDYAPGDAAGAAFRLSARTNAKLASSDFQTVFVVLRNDRALALNTPMQTVTGLDGSPDTARRIEEFLRQRGYTTALSGTAFKTLHDAASLAWDPQASLRVCYENLTRCPDSVYLTLFIAKLRSSPATPETRRYADLLADERAFVYPDRESRVMMGDNYGRLGLREKALEWYRKANLPGSQIEGRAAEQTMFAEGRVAGRLLLNGRPAAGAHVGLVPVVAGQEAFRTFLRPGVLRPFWLRWVSAVGETGVDGRFVMENVVAGNYRLVFTLPQVRLPSFSRVPLPRAPEQIFIGFGKPHVDLGDLMLALPPTALTRPSPQSSSPTPSAGTRVPSVGGRRR